MSHRNHIRRGRRTWLTLTLAGLVSLAGGTLATSARGLVQPAAAQPAGAPSVATQPTAEGGVRRSPQVLYSTQCAGCHGADMKGGSGSNLVDGWWEYGSGEQQVTRRIKYGVEDMGMPAYEKAMTDAEIRGVAQLILAAEREQAGGARRVTATDTLKTRDYTLAFDIVVDSGLRNPWGIAFLPGDEALITEKGGTLRRLSGRKLASEPVQGIPQSREHGQGGLMAVSVDPEFAQNGWVYLGYTHETNNAFLTRIVRGKIVNNRWTDEQLLWAGKPEHYSRAGVHFGTRIVFDKQGHLFFSIGDRGSQNQAQDITRPNGKVHRINRDGSIPKDNPFVGQPNAYESIYSFGNRNPQGLALHPENDQLWATEHGPMGGDELNWIRPGKNYGWPVITFGRNYNGTPVTDKTAQEGMEQPAVQWTPSLAVCGLDFYQGKLLPKWQNNLLAGALALQEIRRIVVDDQGKVLTQETILKNRGRVRDVKVGPDGAIWVITNGPDRIVRLVPANP